MRCTRPLRGFRTKSGGVSLRRQESILAGALPIQLPCGGCAACLLERSRQWAVRCMHEASLHKENCFITLTYDDEHVPDWGSLDKRALCLFWKRLRKEVRPSVIRYFSCGEYGSTGYRPHYHAAVFGFDFPDKEFQFRRGSWPVYRSGVLSRLWPFGFSEVGTFSFESAQYVAQYMVKRSGKRRQERTDDETGELVEVEREFAHMSRRPGVGAGWLEKYRCEVYPSDSVVVRGELCRPPRYYDKLLAKAEPLVLEEVRRKRVAEHDSGDDSPERLEVLEKVVESRLSLTRRM